MSEIAQNVVAAEPTETEQTEQQATHLEPTIAGRLAIQERKEVSPGKPKKTVWLKNEDFTQFSLQAFMPDLKAPYSLESTTLGDDKEKVQTIKYSDPKLQFLFEALAYKVEQSAKGKIASNSEPASTIEELLTSNKSGQYMKDKSAVAKLVTAYLASKGNPETMIAELVKRLNPEILKRATQEQRDTVKLVMQRVAEASDLSPYQSVVDNILTAAEGEKVDFSEMKL